MDKIYIKKRAVNQPETVLTAAASKWRDGYIFPSLSEDDTQKGKIWFQNVIPFQMEPLGWYKKNVDKYPLRLCWERRSPLFCLL